MRRVRLVLLQALQRRLQAIEGALEARVMLPALAQQNTLRELAARLRLHIQQPLKAEQDLVVAPVVAQQMILQMRGAGALVDILRHKVVVQAAAGAARSAIAAQAALQRAFSQVQLRNQLAVDHRGADQGGVVLRLAVGIEQIRLGFKILRQLRVAARQLFLHRPHREHQMAEQRQHVVPERPDQQQYRLHIPLRKEPDAQHGVNRNQQRAKGDGGVALAERAQQNKAPGGERQTGHKGQRMGKQQLYRHRGDTEAEQGNQQIAQPTGKAIVKIGQRRGHHAERQRYGPVYLMQPPGHRRAAGQRQKDAQQITPAAVKEIVAPARQGFGHHIAASVAPTGAGVARGTRFFNRDHAAADRPERDGGDFKVGEAHRNADDADALYDAGGDMGQAEPPAEKDQPENIKKGAAGVEQRAFTLRAQHVHVHRLVAVRQQREFGDFPAGSRQRQGKDQDDTHQRGEQPAKGGDKPAENKIENVQHSAHGVFFLLLSARCAAKFSLF